MDASTFEAMLTETARTCAPLSGLRPVDTALKMDPLANAQEIELIKARFTRFESETKQRFALVTQQIAVLKGSATS